MPSRGVTFPLTEWERFERYNDRQSHAHCWYFLHDGLRDGRGYFVGYDSQSRRCVGFIGRDGVRPDQPPVEQWFPVDGAKLASRTALTSYRFGGDSDNEEYFEQQVWLISGDQLLGVDLQAGSVKTLMGPTELIALAWLSTASTSKAAGEESPHVTFHPHLAVRAADRVVVFDAKGKPHAAFPLPEEFRERSFELYELDPGRALLMADRDLPDGTRHEDLSWIDASGKVLRRAEVPLAGGNGPREESVMMALAVPAPVVLAFLATVLEPLNSVEIGLEPSYSAALARSLSLWWPSLLIVTLLAALLAWHCLRRHRRYYQPASAAWFVFVLLAGVPGLVAYLCHRRWPVLEKCPACGHQVPRDRETCARCTATFPAPEPTGCEVFA